MSETKEQALPKQAEEQRLPVVWEIAVVEKSDTKTMTVVFPARQIFETDENSKQTTDA